MDSLLWRCTVGYPGALCGAAFVGGVLAERASQAILWGTLLAVALVTCLLRGGRGHSPSRRGSVSRRLVLCAVYFALGSARFRVTARSTCDLSAPTAGTACTVVGTVVRPPVEALERDARGAGSVVHAGLELRCPGWPQPIRVIARTPLSGVRGGDVVHVTGVVSQPAGPRHPGEPNAARRLTIEVQHRENVRPSRRGADLWTCAIGRARQHLYDVLSALYEPRARGYFLSILLGDRRLLDPEIRDALLDSGTYHVLAISGLHLGVVMFVVLRVPLPTRLRLGLRLLFLAGFAALTGGNPPVLRAALLFALTLVSARRSRRARPVNTLGWTTLLLLAWNPATIEDIGFQLSFVAVLALTTAHPRLWASPSQVGLLRRELADVENRLSAAARRASRLRSRADEAVRWTRDSLSVSLTAFLGTSPLILHYFHRVHLLSPLWNLLAYPFTLITLFGGGLSLGLGWIDLDLARPLAATVSVMVEWMVVVLSHAGAVPGSTLHVPAPGLPVVLVAYLFLGLCTSLSTRPGPRLAAGVALLAVVSALALRPDRAPTVWTFDAAHGGASLIVLPGSEAILADVHAPSSSPRRARSIASAVLATGHATLRALVLPAPGRTRADTVVCMRERIRVHEVWTTPQFPDVADGRGTLRQLGAAGLVLRRAARGGRWMAPADRGTSLEVIYPGREDDLIDEARPQDASMVLRLTRSGRHVLLASSIGDRGIARLLSIEGGARADVLVFPRGGPERRLVSGLIRAVAPRHVILIGRGDRRDRELARRIERRGVAVLATWRGGAIVTDWIPRRGWVPDYWHP